MNQTIPILFSFALYVLLCVSGLLALAPALWHLKQQGRLKYSLSALLFFVLVPGNLVAFLLYLASMRNRDFLLYMPLFFWTMAGPFNVHLLSQERDMEEGAVLVGTATGLGFGIFLVGLCLYLFGEQMFHPEAILRLL